MRADIASGATPVVKRAQLVILVQFAGQHIMSDKHADHMFFGSKVDKGSLSIG